MNLNNLLFGEDTKDYYCVSCGLENQSEDKEKAICETCKQCLPEV